MEGAPIRECQYIGPDQDPLRNWPIHHCGREVFPGRSYCEEHLWKVYQKGTSIGNRRKLKEIEKELARVKELEEIGDLES
jgi:hypothetical protein